MRHEIPEVVGEMGYVTEITTQTVMWDAGPISTTRCSVRLDSGKEVEVLFENLVRVNKSSLSRKGKHAFRNKVDLAKCPNLLGSYVTVVEFCILKECNAPVVYDLINRGVIQLVTVGMTGDRIMIDFDKYKDLVCRNPKETEQQANNREAYFQRIHPKLYERLEAIKAQNLREPT
ncbi:MAG TPA: hypothetical protein VEA58_05675 [Anaerovoracaceae bacterium]|nr:hypothetical protein [Anaerovoracaceae bacterium]